MSLQAVLTTGGQSFQSQKDFLRRVYTVHDCPHDHTNSGNGPHCTLNLLPGPAWWLSQGPQGEGHAVNRALQRSPSPLPNLPKKTVPSGTQGSWGSLP